eukprot:2756678-Ditylum_brightwellii.AAC.1
MVEGSGLPEKIWSHALYHFAAIHSYLPHYRRVYVRPPGKCRHKLSNHINIGVFLGYIATMKNIIYYNLKTHRSKTATHAQFNEGMNNLETLTPNVKQLKKAL